MMPPPPKKYTNIRIWHHLQVFFDGGGVKKKLKLGQIQKIFSNQMWHHLQVVFFGGGVKKNSNKKSQITRAKCTSALAWSNSKIPVVIFLTPPTFFQLRWCQKSFQSTNPNVQNFRIWHHLHVFSTPPPSFFDGGGVKKSSNLVKFKNLFNSNVTPPPPSLFCWRRCQKKFK